jgi:hypothetical protein
VRDGLVVQLDLFALAERVAALVLDGLADQQAPASPWLELAAEHLSCSPERLRQPLPNREA